MIKGLLVDIPAKELKEHFDSRAEHHRQKAEWYKKRLDVLREEDPRVVRGREMAYEKMSDPGEAIIDIDFPPPDDHTMDSIRRQYEEHKEKCTWFSFLRDHLVPNETYRIDTMELSRIEMSSRYF